MLQPSFLSPGLLQDPTSLHSLSWNRGSEAKLIDRCPVMVLFELPVTVEGNENVLTFSQVSLNRCLAFQQGYLVQSKLYTNAASFFGSQVFMVTSERDDLGTLFEGKAS